MATLAMPLDRTTQPETESPSKPRARLGRARLVLACIVLLSLLVIRPVTRHVQAGLLLTSFSSSDGASRAHVDEEVTIFPTPRGAVQGRLYLPRGVAHPNGVVLVHGLHYRGIEEPRLRRFARSIADTGVAVFTPQIDELADYRVAPSSIETTGAAIAYLQHRLGKHRVGMMGTSFGGGLAILTAARSEWANDVSFVLTIGAHDDLERVTRFFATGNITDPEGVAQKVKPHDYGAMVFIFANAEDFFPAEEAPSARQAIRFWLMENRELARATAALMSKEGQAKVETIFGDDWSTIRPEILSVIEKRKGAMAAVSPHGHLDGLRAPAYFLHGAGDTVVPASESLWLAKDAPSSRVGAVLVSPALVHVELGDVSAADKARLLHFLAQVIDETRQSE